VARPLLRPHACAHPGSRLREPLGHMALTDTAASDLQAARFRSDVTLFRLNAVAVGESRLEPAFRRNTAERVYTTEAAHNPEVAGSNPAPATSKGPGKGAFLAWSAYTLVDLQAVRQAFTQSTTSSSPGSHRRIVARPTERMLHPWFCVTIGREPHAGRGRASGPYTMTIRLAAQEHAPADFDQFETEPLDLGEHLLVELGREVRRVVLFGGLSVVLVFEPSARSIRSRSVVSSSGARLASITRRDRVLSLFELELVRDGHPVEPVQGSHGERPDSDCHEPAGEQ
jgi:hypothetical protein